MSTTTTTSLPFPGFYSPAGVADLGRWLNYGEIANTATEFRKSHGLKPASTDRKTIALLNIDTQVTFCHPQGELAVGGAVEDTQRVVEFVYRNAGVLTRIENTLDTHRAYAIFHPPFFVDENGDNPPPYTPISHQDVLDGKWKASIYMASALRTKLMTAQLQLEDYTKKLEASGRYALMVWPYHAMLGSKGYALMPGLEEACHFHAIARGAQPEFRVKGLNVWTENYSVLGPEVTSLVNGAGVPRNTLFLEALLSADYLVIAGQAKSHCVAWTIADLLGDIQKKDPALAEKVYLLEDCTSPVVTPAYDFTPEANAAFDRFRDAGMHVVRSTTPIEDWAGVEL